MILELSNCAIRISGTSYATIHGEKVKLVLSVNSLDTHLKVL